MYFKENTKGRDFVVGDLHGCFKEFTEKLKEINFNVSKDRMFSVGDLIDRGEESVKCLHLLKTPWFHSVIGNHEDMLINATLHGSYNNLWLQNGGAWYLEEDPAELEELALLANELPYTIEVETAKGLVGIAHAQPLSLDWDDTKVLSAKDKEILVWARSWIVDRSMPDVANIYKTYHGHTPVTDIVTISNVNFIDTGAVYKQIETARLTVVEL